MTIDTTSVENFFWKAHKNRGVCSAHIQMFLCAAHYDIMEIFTLME